MTRKDKSWLGYHAGQPGCSSKPPVQNQTQTCNNPLLLRCEQGANSTEWRQFKDVSCESAYRQLWELFLKREEAVATSPGGTGTMCCRSHFLLCVPYVASFSLFSSPPWERNLILTLTSVMLGSRREVGSILQPPVNLGAGALLRQACPESSRWVWREAWFPTD